MPSVNPLHVTSYSCTGLMFSLAIPCALCNITSMARGPSGRIVVELEPALKQDLHAALAADNTTLKEWVEAQANAYLDQRSQPRLPGFSGPAGAGGRPAGVEASTAT